MLIDDVRAYCARHQLFRPGPVVVAVSGGADSLTLLHVLLTFRDEFAITLHAATFDHQIRGETSAEDCRFVCDLAATWGVPVTSGTANVPMLANDWSMGLEAAARKARYAFLTDVAHKLRSEQIALGHNQDDQAETVLMHAVRGAGLAGLRGMLPKMTLPGSSLVLVRPLLDIPRAAIDAYIRELGIQPRTDTTNADTAYTRNRIRHELMPLLERINLQAKAALARTADLAREEFEALRSSLPSFEHGRTGISISRERFLELSTAQQRLWLRLAAQTLAPGLELGFERTMAAVTLVKEHSHAAKLALGEHVWLRIASETITIFDETAHPADCPWMEPGSFLSITREGVYALPGGVWLLEVRRSAFRFADLGPLSALLVIGERVEIRTRRTGDRFRPHGAGGHSQKLSDTLINMKVPAHWRDRVPLLVVDDQIAWFVAPLAQGPRRRVADQVAVRQGENRPIWRFDFRRV
jgi:tRNA(Ile)-lysidine synthase